MAEESTLNISDATVLAFDYEVVNFQSAYRFGIRENITVSVSKIKCGAGEQGSIGEQAKILDDLVATKDYIALTIHGHEFEHLFQLTSFTIDEGDWTLSTSGTLTLQSFHEGNVSTGDAQENEDYAGWENLTDAQYLENFKDNFSFKRQANGISYNHDIEIKFASINPVNGQHITPPLTAGLELAQNLITTRPVFDWLKEPQLQGLYSDIGNNCKRLITESVDEINNTVSVTETFNAENIKDESSCLYSFSAVQGIEITEEGIINVSEQGVVINLRTGTLSRRGSPEDCLELELNEAIKPGGRLQKMFDYYKPKLMEGRECKSEIKDLVTDTGGNLILIEKGIVRDTYRGRANYSIKATNDQKINEDAVHEFTTTIESINPGSGPCDSFLQVTTQGSFTGNDAEGRNFIENNGVIEWIKYDKAKEAWDDKKDEIKTDLKECADVSESKYHVSISNTHSKYKGKIAYNIKYSQEAKYGDLGTPYKLWTYTYQDEFTQGDAKEDGAAECLWQHTLQNVINRDQKTQVLQERNTTILPSSTMTQKMVGKRGRKIKELTNVMKGKASPKNKKGPKTLTDCNYTFNPENDIIVDATFTWQ